MKLIKLIILILIIFFVIVGATSFTYYFMHKPEIIIVKMDLKVEDADLIGVNSDIDALHFGTLPPASGGTRMINVSNNQDYNLKVEVILEGELAPWVTVTPNPLILEPQETFALVFEVSVPGGAEEKIYTGTIYIIQRRA